MIILDAEFPAGLTIEDAIKDALDFSEKNHCMLRCELNDVKLIIVAGLLPRDEAVKYYKEMYDSEARGTYPKTMD